MPQSYSNHAMPTSLVEEIPVAIVVNGISFAVMLASPFDIEDFVIGFLHSESVIKHNHDIHEIETEDQDDAKIVKITIANRCLNALNLKKRALKGATGCGLCGIQALAMAFPKLTPLNPHKPMALSKTLYLKHQLRDWQQRGRESGALHAAFWIDAEGRIQHCREDIGRHNALDKVIGLLLRNQRETTGGALLVTSRCSVELVQKTLLMGIENLISLASPSRLAVKMARQYGLTLIHIPKQDAPYYLAGGQCA